jgi:ribosomal 50S subunit-recycling heat shock protein
MTFKNESKTIKVRGVQKNRKTDKTDKKLTEKTEPKNKTD